MNDSLRTDVFVRFQPESIACACIYLAARTLEVSHSAMDFWVFFKPFYQEEKSELCLSLSLSPFQIPLPNRPHWFLLFGATEEEIQEICLKILQLYTRKKVWFFFMLGALSEGCSSEQELEILRLFKTTAASLEVNKDQSLSGTPWISIPLPGSG